MGEKKEASSRFLFPLSYIFFESVAALMPPAENFKVSPTLACRFKHAVN